MKLPVVLCFLVGSAMANTDFANSAINMRQAYPAAPAAAVPMDETAAPKSDTGRWDNDGQTSGEY